MVVAPQLTGPVPDFRVGVEPDHLVPTLASRIARRLLEVSAETYLAFAADHPTSVCPPSRVTSTSAWTRPMRSSTTTPITPTRDTSWERTAKPAPLPRP